MVPEIHIEDYSYPLSDDRIAKYPLEQRDASKLLHYKDGKIEEKVFRELPALLSEETLTETKNMIGRQAKIISVRERPEPRLKSFVWSR